MRILFCRLVRVCGQRRTNYARIVEKTCGSEPSTGAQQLQKTRVVAADGLAKDEGIWREELVQVVQKALRA